MELQHRECMDLNCHVEADRGGQGLLPALSHGVSSNQVGRPDSAVGSTATLPGRGAAHPAFLHQSSPAASPPR